MDVGLTMLIGRNPFPSVAPKPLANCARCPQDTDHFAEDLIPVTLKLPVVDITSMRRPRHSNRRKAQQYRLHHSDALLCSQHYTKYLAQKEI